MQFLGLHESDCGPRRRCGRTMSSSSLLSLCCCCGAARSTGHPITYLVVVVVDDVTTYVVSSTTTIANSGRALGTQTCERRRSAPGSSKASGSIACAAKHGACVSNDNRVMAVHAGVTWPTKESIVSFTMQRRRFSTKRTPKNIHPWSKVKQSSRWCLLAFSPKRLLPLLSLSISSTKESPDGFPSTNSFSFVVTEQPPLVSDDPNHVVLRWSQSLAKVSSFVSPPSIPTSRLLPNYRHLPFLHYFSNGCQLQQPTTTSG